MTKDKRIWWGAGVILIVATCAWWFGVHTNRPDLGVNSALGGPVYVPLTTETSIEQGKVKSAAYDSKSQVYSFRDSYHGAAITVSQQPAPQKVKTQPAELANVAKGIGASQKVSTSHGDAYIATNEASGSQRLVLLRGDLLVFIHSEKKLAQSLWADYVESLK